MSIAITNMSGQHRLPACCLPRLAANVCEAMTVWIARTSYSYPASGRTRQASDLCSPELI